MVFTIEELPYAKTALEPYISKETLEFHYEKHHKGYLNKLNELVKDKPEEKMTIEEIIKTASGVLYNQAAQVYNHSFYWKCMTPEKTTPSNELKAAIEKKFGTVEEFVSAFSSMAASHFGSGWIFLVKDKENNISIEGYHDAGCPVKEGKTPLLTIDVWEHAYYLDRQNARPAYITNFCKIINWKFVSENFSK